MDTRQSEHSKAKSSTNKRNPFELLIKIIRLPNVCNKCGHITRLKEISDILEQFDTITYEQLDNINEKLIQKSNQILAARQQLVRDTKNELQQSLQQLIQVRQSLGSSFNFEDREKCLERVCEDIFCNVQEQIEIQNSLSELNLIIQEQFQKFHQYPNEITEINQSEYHENLEIRERLEGALRINQSHKGILKDILIKIGEENKSYTFDIQLQFRQLQLEMLNLLQSNQEQIKDIERLEEEINDKKLELQKYAILFSQFENPFKSNKMPSEESSASNYPSLQKEYAQASSVKQSRNVFQDIKNIQSKRFSQPSVNDNNGVCTFQSEQFYSIDQSNHSHHQDTSQKSSQTGSKQVENSVIINQRYGNSLSNKFNNSKAASLLQQMNVQQQSTPVQIIPNHSTKKIRSSIDTNPMMSQESFEHENDENSPKIGPTSKTLLTKVPVPQVGRILELE